MTYIESDVSLRDAIDVVRARLDGRASAVALVLGSGLGRLTHRIADPVEIRFAELPGFPTTAVPGHDGRFVAGMLGGASVLACAGRLHLYEGHPPSTIALPIRLAHAAGAHTLVVANAAGAIRRTLRAGDLMLIHDHINLMWRNPLIGPVRDGELRFPDMSRPYDLPLLAALRDAALDVGVPVAEGIYAGVLGPSYETLAEIRMLERLGADAVGMSTVPEVIVARALGMRVAGVSCITNAAAGFAAGPLSHADVLAVSERTSGRLERLVLGFLDAVSSPTPALKPSD